MRLLPQLILFLLILPLVLPGVHAADEYCCLNQSSTNYCHTLIVNSPTGLADLCSSDPALVPQGDCYAEGEDGTPLYPECTNFCCCNPQDGSVIRSADTYASCESANGLSIPNPQDFSCETVCETVKRCESIPEELGLNAHIIPGTSRVELSWQACQPRSVELTVETRDGDRVLTLTSRDDPSLLLNTITLNLKGREGKNLLVTLRVEDTDGSLTQTNEETIIVNIGDPEACAMAGAYDTPFCQDEHTGGVCTEREDILTINGVSYPAFYGNELVGTVSCRDKLFCRPNYAEDRVECSAQSRCEEKNDGLGSTTQASCEREEYEGETVPSGCYADRDILGRLTCLSCENVKSCYDYKSRTACESNACGLKDCAWIPLGGSADTGEGVCVSMSENTCPSFNEGKGFANQLAYTPLVEATTAENAPLNKGNACSTDGCPGYTCPDLTPSVCGIDGFPAEFTSDECSCLSPRIGACRHVKDTWTRLVDGETPCLRLDGRAREACEADVTPPRILVRDDPAGRQLIIRVQDQTVIPGDAWEIRLILLNATGEDITRVRIPDGSSQAISYDTLTIHEPGAYRFTLRAIDPVGNEETLPLTITYLPQREAPPSRIHSQIAITYQHPVEGLENGTTLLSIHLYESHADTRSSVEVPPSRNGARLRYLIRTSTPDEASACDLLTEESPILVASTITLRELLEEADVKPVPGEYWLITRAEDPAHNLVEAACHVQNATLLPPYTLPLEDTQPPRTTLSVSYDTHRMSIRITIRDRMNESEEYAIISKPYEKGFITNLTLVTPGGERHNASLPDPRVEGEVLSQSLLEDLFGITLIPGGEYTLRALTRDPAGNLGAPVIITFYPPNPTGEGVDIKLIKPLAARAGEPFTIQLRSSPPAEACNLTANGKTVSLTYKPEKSVWESGTFKRTTELRFTVSCAYPEGTEGMPTGGVKKVDFTIPVYGSDFTIRNARFHPNPVFSMVSGAYESLLRVSVNHLAICRYTLDGDEHPINLKPSLTPNTTIRVSDEGDYPVNIQCRDVLGNTAETSVTLKTGLREDWIMLEKPESRAYNTTKIPLLLRVPDGSVCSVSLGREEVKTLIRKKPIPKGVLEQTLSVREDGAYTLRVNCSYDDGISQTSADASVSFMVDTKKPKGMLKFDNTTRDLTLHEPGVNLTVRASDATLRQALLIITIENRSNTSQTWHESLPLDIEDHTIDQTLLLSPESRVWRENTRISASLILRDAAGHTVEVESENSLTYKPSGRLERSCGKGLDRLCEENESCLFDSDCANGLTCERQGGLFGKRVCLPETDKGDENTTRTALTCADPINKCGGDCKPCTVGGSCTEDRDCESGLTCSDTGVCTDEPLRKKDVNTTTSVSETRPVTSTCLSDDECGEGFYCDLESQSCQPLQQTGSGWLVWLLIPLLLAIAGAAAWYLYQQQADGKKEDEDEDLTLSLPVDLPQTMGQPVQAQQPAQTVHVDYAKAGEAVHEKHAAEREKLMRAFEHSLLDTASKHEQKETKREKKFKDYFKEE